jgi:hypothetical protein
MLLWFIYGPWAGLTTSLKHYLGGISLYTRLYFLLYFYGPVEVFTEAIRMWFHF